MKKNVSLKCLTIYIIIILFAIYLLFYGSLGYFYTNQGSETVYYKASDSDISSFSMYMAGIMLVIFGVLKLHLANKANNAYLACVLLLFAFMLIFAILSIAEKGLIDVLRMPITPFVYMLFLGVFACLDEEVIRIIKKLSIPIGSVCIIVAFFYVIRFNINYGGVISNSPQIIYLSTGFWPFAFGILTDENSSFKKKLYIYLVLILALLTAAIYGTRGWCIQVLLLMLIYTFKNTKKSIGSIIKILIVVAVVFIVAYLIFQKYFPWYYNYLLNRLFSDSRSWQYREIFEQNSFLDLFFGKGMFATYESSHYGAYSYIDNGFIQMLFYFGAIPLLLYVLILLIPLFKCLKYKIPFRKKMVSMVLVLWILAIGGLSVYNVAIMDMRLFYIVATCAYCLNDKNFTGGVKKYENTFCCR